MPTLDHHDENRQEPRPKSATRVGYAGGMGQAQVLLVDDDHRDLVALTAVLEEAGFVVSAATNAYEAFRVLQTWSVDIVVTDVDMPGVSGLELLRAFGETRPALPVLVMTTVPSAEGEQVAYDLGARAYLRKPVSAPLLLDAVARALGPR
jgi:DNA-binding NtrC family response regulator